MTGPREPSAREFLAREFLERHGWGNAVRAPLAGDASSRRYERLEGPMGRRVLMDAPPAAESAPCPPDASPEERARLGYNALARLAGPDSRPYAAMAGFLAACGLSAPRIHGADYTQGLLLLEDLGDGLFSRVIGEGQEAPRALYEAAIDVLAHLHAASAPGRLAFGGDAGEVALLHYDATAMQAEADLVLDWYVPAALGRPASAGERDAYRTHWADLLAETAAGPEVVVLRDFHADNLIWLPERETLGRVGLLDFQDGLRGNTVYDLVSLLEDARRDVDPALARAMAARYLDATANRPGALNADAFSRAYAIQAAQRNAKIVGIFARLAARDGKRAYLDFLPRVWGYLENDLSHPALAPLRGWFDTVLPPPTRRLDGETALAAVRAAGQA